MAAAEMPMVYRYYEKSRTSAADGTSFRGCLSEEIRELVRAQKKVVLISEDNREPFPEDAELKAGIIEYLVPEHFREPKEEEQQMDQIRLIMDSEYILTGTVTGKSSDTCLYSGQKNFVRVFKDAMRNEIALIRLKQGEQ